MGTATAALAVGGVTLAGPWAKKDEVESWNGTSWTEIADINTARQNKAPAGQGTTTAALVFSGTPMTQLAEQFDGSSWTEVGDLNTGREMGGGAGISTLALCFGGNTPPVTANTEEFDGTSWTEVANVPIAEQGGTGAGTQAAAKKIGGLTGSSYKTTTFDWTKAIAAVTMTSS